MTPPTTSTRPAGAQPPTVWSNANAGEVLPGVVTPLMWSVMTQVMDAMVDALMGATPPGVHRRPIVGLVAGRAYFDLGALDEAAKQMPLLGSLDATQLLGGLQESPEYEEAATVLRSQAVQQAPGGLLRGLLALPRSVGWASRHRPGRSRQFVASARAQSDRLTSAPLESMTESELTTHCLTALGSMNELVDSVGFSGVAMALFTLLGRLCSLWLRDADGRTTRLLVTGLGGIGSAEAGFALQRLADLVASEPRLREALESSASLEEARPCVLALGPDGVCFFQEWDRFMKEHGHHGMGELEVATPRWHEEPDLILAAVLSASRGVGRSDTLSEAGRRAADRSLLTRQCRRRIPDPVRRWLFDAALRGAQRGSIARENGKSEAIRRISAIRGALLELGVRMAARGALANRDDIFFLTISEIEAVGSGRLTQDMVLSIAADRKLEHERNLALVPPHVVIGDYRPSGPSVVARIPVTTLRGLPAGPGIAEGPARVFTSADSGRCVRPGEILVAPFTDPGWTPYFLPAAGIVTDMGGLLSHSSIMAREYGIPAVVNVGTATRDIATGQIIRVDGSLGIVQVQPQTEV